MGKEWEIFPLLGKPWDKKFLFREILGICHSQDLSNGFLLGELFCYFYYQYWENLGYYFPCYFQVVNSMGKFSQVIPNVVNDMETFSQVIPKVMNNKETFPTLFPKL